MKPGRNILLVSAVLMAMLSVSCGRSNALNGSKVEPVADSSSSIPAGIPAPQFTVKTPSGETRSLEDYRGKPLLVVFWATWCGNCMRELPSLSYMRNQISEDKLAMLAINLGENPATVASFLKKVPLPYEIGIDPRQKTADQFGVEAIPMMVLINKTGNMVRINFGLDDRMVAMIKEMTGS